MVLGQGPIGLMFTMLVKRSGATHGRHRHHAVPPRAGRALRRRSCACDPREPALAANASWRLTDGRGADLVIVAASAPGIVEQAVRYSRPGSRILLFAQTSHRNASKLSGADICVGERTIFGSL